MDSVVNNYDFQEVSLSSSLEEPQLEMINHFETVDFDNSLMPDLDSDLLIVESHEDNSVLQYMDIRKPLSQLKELLEKKLNKNFTDYSFYLQGTQFLENERTLVDQCVQGEGLVQINCNVVNNLKRIDIIDVLKPADEQNEVIKEDAVIPEHSQKKIFDKKSSVIQWQVDDEFKREMQKLKIPSDPQNWDVVHVQYWVQWAVRQFNLTNIKLSDWSMTGQDLFNMNYKDFKAVVKNDPGDTFWTHFELLRKMRSVTSMRAADKDKEEFHFDLIKNQPILMSQDKVSRIMSTYSSIQYLDNSGNKMGNNGQTQLWQFLLELLTSREYRNIIHWIGEEGEFKFCRPEVVAQLWGKRKNKPTMNYEKLSRALRYYYYGDMISKVHGKRFVYKFVCDLKHLLGYSAIELAKLVNHGNPRFKK